MPEPLNEEQYLSREAFARYGLALYHAQCLEKTLAIILTIAPDKDLSMTPAQIDYEMDETFNKTFGDIIKELKTMFKNLEDKLVNRLEAALLLRNRLAHDYWWENAVAIMRLDGKKAIILEMDKTTMEFMELDAIFMDLLMEQRRMLHITDEMVEQMAEKTKQGAVEYFKIKKRKRGKH
jgi:hypothetical protein